MYMCVYVSMYMCLYKFNLLITTQKNLVIHLKRKFTFITDFLKMGKKWKNFQKENYHLLESWIQSMFLEKYNTSKHQCAQGTGTPMK